MMHMQVKKVVFILVFLQNKYLLYIPIIIDNQIRSGLQFAQKCALPFKFGVSKIFIIIIIIKKKKYSAR